MVYCVSDFHGKLPPSPTHTVTHTGKTPCGNIGICAVKE